jgi:WD40 repeat protein
MTDTFTAYDFDAFVTAALFDSAGSALFALGDGRVMFEGDGYAGQQAHEGAVLAAALHPGGHGVVTGGDDGRLVWSRYGHGPVVLAEAKGKWIDVVATSAASGLIAFAAGREVTVLDAADPAFARRFQHEKSVAGLAFDAKGRRLASATYGGAWLWWARIAEQKPQIMKWAGSHAAVAWSPDGKFLISAMQENQLHGWRMADGKDMRMGGYPAKPRSLAFVQKGAALITSGSNGAVVWPFVGGGGPMGKEAAEIAHRESSLVTQVAGQPNGSVVAAGLSDGGVWAANMTGGRQTVIRGVGGAPVTALALSADASRLVFGDEAGQAGVAALPAL